MKYTFFRIEEWCGLFRGDELLYEGHSMDIVQLAEYTGQDDGDIELAAYNYPDEGPNAAAFDAEQGFGGFGDRPLSEWVELSGEPVG